MHKLVFWTFFLSSLFFSQQLSGLKIGRLKYKGGSDWYNDPSSEINLLKYISENNLIKTNPVYEFVDISSPDIFNYPILFLTGHGNIFFDDDDARNLRNYLLVGGFLYVDDDYGLDKAFRREIKKVLPDIELVELPFDYGLYNCWAHFPYGPPKIHEHDNKPPQGFGIFIGDRLAVYYTYESNPSDGWADAEVHKNPPETREKALKFGANLIIWVLSQ
jgi:hypothetical protein